MKNFSTTSLFLILLLSLFTAPSAYADGLSVDSQTQSSTQSKKPPRTIRDVNDKLEKISDWIDYYNKIKEVLNNRRACLERGFDEIQCNNAAAFCLLKDEALAYLVSRSISISFIEALDLQQILATDCGNGECFQCCHTPPSSCHTSFVGFPVINCNSRYGVGTNAAGMALLIDSQPGDACLYTRQTCDHIAKCNNPDDASDDDGIPIASGIMSDPSAISQRAKVFAESMMAAWINYLDNTASSEISATQLLDFIAGEGCIGWREVRDEMTSTGPEYEAFRVTDADGQFLLEPSQLSMLRQLGILRVLASIPNLAKRLEFVESRVWSEEAKQNYLQNIDGDADSVLLTQMHPLVLSLLKSVTTVQDYRLLAVPLEDEDATLTQYNGCELGEAPILTSDINHIESSLMRLTLRMGQTSNHSTLPVTIFWGDGQIERSEFVPGQTEITIDHNYENSGEYHAIARIKNDTGLSGAVTLPVNVPENDSDSTVTGDSPIPLSLRLTDVQQYTQTLAGRGGKLYFKVLGRVADGTEYELYTSPTRKELINETLDFGSWEISNNAGRPFTHLIIKPFHSGGYAVGFKQRYFSINDIELEFFDTYDENIVTDMSITSGLLTAFDVSGVELDVASFINEDGRIQIPFRKRRPRIILDRLEIQIPNEILETGRIAPKPAGTIEYPGASWAEIRPGEMREVE